MNRPNEPLDAWLAVAREDLARQSPPGWIESAIAARLDERALAGRLQRVPAPAPAPSARKRRRVVWFGIPAALAASGVLVLAWMALAVPRPDALPPPAFVALTALETIAAEPRPLVVASQLPRAQLAAFGLPVDPARADRPVRAEFLVSQRGAVLAVRFSPE
jgi:hypothetical protein